MLMKVLSVLLWLGLVVQVAAQDSVTQPADTAPSYLGIRAQGWCLPFEICDVRIAGSIHISNSRVNDLCFITNDEVIAVTVAGEVFIYSISQNECVTVLELGEGFWLLLAVSSDAFVIWEPVDDAEYRYYTRDGDLIWNHPWGGTLGMPVTDGSSVLVPHKRQDGQSSVVVLDQNGQVTQTIDLGIRVFFDLLPCDIGVLVLDRHTSPQILERSGNEYLLEPWCDGMLESTARNSTYDSEGRLVSLELANTILRITDRTIPVAENVMVWGEEIDGEWQEEYPWPERSMIASNGETVAILQLNRLLKYEDGVLTAWIDDFNHLGFELDMQDFVIDSPCRNFLVLEPDGMLVGRDQIQRLSFEGSVSVAGANFEFSPDMRTAAVGTSEGSVIIIEIQPS